MPRPRPLLLCLLLVAGAAAATAEVGAAPRGGPGGTLAPAGAPGGDGSGASAGAPDGGGPPRRRRRRRRHRGVWQRQRAARRAARRRGGAAGGAGPAAAAADFAAAAPTNHSASGNGTAGAAAPGAARFFIDEGYFEEGETEVLRAHIAAAGGRLVVSGESTAAFLSVKGYYVPATWDVYVTVRQVQGADSGGRVGRGPPCARRRPAARGRLGLAGRAAAAALGATAARRLRPSPSRQACHMAFPHMRPGQRANCVPGVRAITLKKQFVESFQQVRRGGGVRQGTEQPLWDALRACGAAVPSATHPTHRPWRPAGVRRARV
jgi:hypothetical protein